MIYRLKQDVTVEKATEGGTLISSRPLRVVQLNPALLKLVRRIEHDWLQPETEAETKALVSLYLRGFVERKWQEFRASDPLPQVSVIIPVKDRPEDLRNCLTSLQELEYPQENIEVVVVDDGSTDNTPQVAEELGAILVRTGTIAGGPALARNRGVKVASGEILAFIDSDCTASRLWLKELLPVFADKEVAAVGGLVDGMYKETALDRYEAVMSSLSLGRREMSGAAGNDTFYLPSCNLLVRKKVFADAGGFHAELHVGEDVDLTWRLRDAGRTIVYLPQGTVFHAHRSKVWPFMKRRFDYGTSEGMLQQLHPLRRKKMLLPPRLCAALALCAITLSGISPYGLLAALLVMLADAAIVRSQAGQTRVSLSYFKVLLSRGRAFASLAYYLGYHMLRYYGIPLLVSALLWPGFGVFLLFLFLWASGVDYFVRKPQMLLPAFVVFYLLEHFSYGMGVLWGCLGQRSFASYLPEFRRPVTEV